MTLGDISVEVTQSSRETHRCAGSERSSRAVGGRHGYHRTQGDMQGKRSMVSCFCSWPLGPLTQPCEIFLSSGPFGWG